MEFLFFSRRRKLGPQSAGFSTAVLKVTMADDTLRYGARNARAASHNVGSYQDPPLPVLVWYAIWEASIRSL